MSIKGNFFDGYSQQFIQQTILKASKGSPVVSREQLSSFLKTENPGRDSYKAATALLQSYSQLDVNQNGFGGNDDEVGIGDVIAYAAKHGGSGTSTPPVSNPPTTNPPVAPAPSMNTASLCNTLNIITGPPTGGGTFTFPGGSITSPGGVPWVTKNMLDQYVSKLQASGAKDAASITNLQNAEFMDQNFTTLSAASTNTGKPGGLATTGLTTTAAEDGNSQSISTTDLADQASQNQRNNQFWNIGNMFPP